MIPAKDQKWYDKLTAIKGARAVHAYLPGMTKQIRRRYPPRMWEKAEAELRALSDEVKVLEDDTQIRHLYRAAIKEQLLKGNLLAASWSNDVEAFKAINTQLYGTIDHELWQATGAYLRTMLDRRMRRKGLAADFVWPAAIEQASTSIAAYLPKNSDFLALQALYNDLPWVKRLHELVPNKASPTIEELVEVCQIALDDVLEMPHIRVVRKHSAIFRMRVAHGSKLLIYGHNQMLIPRQRVLGLVMNHEIGTHILRRYLAHQAPIALFRIGLNNYEIGEEGLAVLVEMLAHKSRGHSLRSKRFLTILMRYYAAGLLAGLGGPAYSDSRIVLQHCRRYFYLWLKTSAKTENVSLLRREARMRAKILLRSLLRGVGHNNLNAYFGRPTCYLPAFIAIFNLLTQTSDQTELHHLFMGHYNPLKEEHHDLVARFPMPRTYELTGLEGVNE